MLTIQVLEQQATFWHQSISCHQTPSSLLLTLTSLDPSTRWNLLCRISGNLLPKIEPMASCVSYRVIREQGWPISASPNGTGGRIIFVSATLHYAGTPLQLHASAAKAGIDSMSASICIEEGPRGLTSNVIAPGAIGGTEGMARLAPPPGSEGAREYKGVPTGRAGHVKEISDATVYLFSDAGNYVNGAEIVGKWSSSAWTLSEADFI
jgi:NAD(P)-dependent dehydrogenase (short-subunit alcohol dehydrogenase family)